MAPTEGPEILTYCSSGTVIVTGATAVVGAVADGSVIHPVSIARTVAIRLLTVDKDHIASFQIILLSFIGQLSLSILDHKAKVRL